MVNGKNETEDKAMRGYLLGNLPEEEKGHLEERFLSDGAYFDQLSAEEEELIDAYIHRELEKPDRERFEQYFMKSPLQRTRVERSASVLRSLETIKVVRPRPRTSGAGSRFLLAAAALLIVVAGPWLLTQRSRLRAQIQESQTTLSQQHDVEQQLREQQNKAGLQIQELSKQLRELGSPQLNSVILDAYPSRFARNADGRAPNELTVRSDAKTITLLLHSASRTVYPRYRVEILDASSGVIWQGDGLIRQPTGEYVISLPGSLLPPGEYSVVIAPDQNKRGKVERYAIKIVGPT